MKEEEEDFEQQFETQYEKMLEADIEQNIDVEGLESENIEESASAEYKRTKDQLKQFLNMSPTHKEGEKPKEDEDILDDASENYFKKLKGSDEESDFEKQFNELVDIYTILSRKKILDEESDEMIEKCCFLVRRIMQVWDTQEEILKQKCSRETILKGLLFLMNTKDIELLLELCEVGILVFKSLYATYKKTSEKSMDFYYVFNTIHNIVKILYKISKDATNDYLFRKSAALDESLNITNLFVSKEERSIFVNSASKLIETTKNDKKSVVVKNENNAYELLIFMVGTYKNLSIARENRNIMVEKGILAYLINLMKSICKADNELKDKLPQCLVQITGAIRNLSSDTDNALSSTVKDIIGILKAYSNSHFELSFNCLRILSKISINPDYAAQILKSDCCEFLVEMLKNNIDKPLVFIRVAFILGNITMIFGIQCKELYENPICFEIVYNAMMFYLDTWKQKESGKTLDLKNKGIKNIEEFIKNFNNDVVVKAVRLCANLWISEDLGKRESAKICRDNFDALVAVIGIELTEANEDLLLNGLSCLSNILFFFPTIPNDIAIRLLTKCKNIFGITSNPEIRIECIRIWANLSRDNMLVPLFLDFKVVDILFEVLTGLKTEPREAFYGIGVLINLSADEKLREALYGPRIGILLKKLEAAGLEDPELAKNLCKLLVNLCDKKGSETKWSNEQIETADKILSALGEECDSLREVANEKEKEILDDLHKVANNLSNVLPEISFGCTVPDCGRKFKTIDDLNKHIERRHNKGSGQAAKK